MVVEFLGLVVVLFLVGPLAKGLSLSAQTQLNTTQAVSDATDALVKGLGWDKNDIKISNIDTANIKFGQTVVYEFDIQVGDVLLPLRLLEDITSWQILDELPLVEQKPPLVSEGSKLDHIHHQPSDANLASFELSAPIEFLIQDAEQLHLVLPNVDAGILKKVLLSEEAREIILEKPMQLSLPPLPSPSSHNEGSLVELSDDRLKHTSLSEKRSPLSLRIVGPTSPATSPRKNLEKSGIKPMKVKRLVPGAVVSDEDDDALTGVPELDQDENGIQPLNGTHPTLHKVEEALNTIASPKVYTKPPPLKLLSAKASSATFVRIEFELKRAMAISNESFPEWMTRPAVQRLQFEVIAKVEGQSLLPIRLQQVVEPHESFESVSWRELNGNVSYTQMPHFVIPPSPLTLDPAWDIVFD